MPNRRGGEKKRGGGKALRVEAPLKNLHIFPHLYFHLLSIPISESEITRKSSPKPYPPQYYANDSHRKESLKQFIIDYPKRVIVRKIPPPPKTRNKQKKAEFPTYTS